MSELEPAPALPYKVVCISMYHADIAALDERVALCRAGGLTRMSKSQLIRIALRRLDLEAVIADGGELR